MCVRSCVQGMGESGVRGELCSGDVRERCVFKVFLCAAPSASRRTVGFQSEVASSCPQLHVDEVPGSLPPPAPAPTFALPLFRAFPAAVAQELWLCHPPLGYHGHPGSMADEDLIFRLEGVGGSQTSGAGHDGDSDTDSDDEEGYFICPITDDPRAHQHGSCKGGDEGSHLMKSEQHGFGASPGSSLHFKVSGSPSIYPTPHSPRPPTTAHLSPPRHSRHLHHLPRPLCPRPGHPLQRLSVSQVGQHCPLHPGSEFVPVKQIVNLE